MPKYNRRTLTVLENDSGIEYNPIIKVVPLGVSIEEIQDKVDISYFSVNIQIATPMKSLGKEIRTALEEQELYHF